MVDNQHRKIKGYRDLTEGEIALMNEIKDLSIEAGKLCDKLVGKDGGSAPDQRCVEIARTDLQKGFMFLVRSVAKPGT